MRNGWTQSNEISWDDVPDNGPGPLEEGVYRARISSAKPTPTKAEGNPMVTFELEIYEDAEGNKLLSKSGKETKRKVKDYIPLSEDAAFRVKIICKALELNPKESLPNTSFQSAETFCRDAVAAAKNGCYVRIKHETRTTADGEFVNMRVARYLHESEVRQAADADAAPPPRRARRGDQAAAAE